METLKSTPFTAEQVALFRTVIAHVEKDLRRLEMGVWGRHYPPQVIKKHPRLKKQMPPCGTQACFAGWAVVLNEPAKNIVKFATHYDFMEASLDAEKLLGLTYEEAEMLFYTGVNMPKRQQLKLVKTALNKIFKGRGMKERF